MKIRMMALATVLAATASVAHAGGTPDAGIAKKLDAAGLKYEVDGDGDYKLLFEAEGDRTQIVWVRSSVETLGNMRIREVMAIGGKMPTMGKDDGVGMAATIALTSTTVLAVAALADANEKKLGGWVLKGKGDDQALYFVAQVPADLSAGDLETVLGSVARSADKFEQTVESFTEAEKDKY